MAIDMSLEVDATYEDGVLRLDAPLPLAEHQRVRVTVQPPNRAAHKFGIIGWKGDPEIVRRAALDPEPGAEDDR